MVLEVRGMATAKESFVQLWGKYVDGFRQDKHCIFCLKGPKETKLHRAMVDDDYPLRDSYRYFYLFAMGRGNRRETNVHLPVERCPGAVASVGSVYGVTFTIRDAREIRVNRLPRGWMGLGELYTNCRNFQFGVQEFGYTVPGTQPSTGSVSLLPSPPEAR